MYTKSVVAVVATLTLAGSAGGYVVGRVFSLKSGDTAAFDNGWRCHYGYPRKGDIDCFVGDTTPGVQLLGPTRRGPLSLRVRATVGSTHVSRVRKRICAEPKRCWNEDIYTFRGGAGG